jgi:hypothetical protein
MDVPPPRSQDSETAQDARLAVDRFSEYMLSRQTARIAEIRAVSAAMEAALLATETESPQPEEIMRSRRAIRRSQELVQRTCEASETSTKRIARSRARMAQSLSRHLSLGAGAFVSLSYRDAQEPPREQQPNRTREGELAAASAVAVGGR